MTNNCVSQIWDTSPLRVIISAKAHGCNLDILKATMFTIQLYLSDDRNSVKLEVTGIKRLSSFCYTVYTYINICVFATLNIVQVHYVNQ